MRVQDEATAKRVYQKFLALIAVDVHTDGPVWYFDQKRVPTFEQQVNHQFMNYLMNQKPEAAPKMDFSDMKAEIRFCPNCGTERKGGLRFCSECGARLSK